MRDTHYTSVRMALEAAFESNCMEPSTYRQSLSSLEAMMRGYEILEQSLHDANNKIQELQLESDIWRDKLYSANNVLGSVQIAIQAHTNKNRDMGRDR